MPARAASPHTIIHKLQMWMLDAQYNIGGRELVTDVSVFPYESLYRTAGCNTFLKAILYTH